MSSPHGPQYWSQYPPPPPHAQYPQPGRRNRALLWSLVGGGLAIVLVVAGTLLFLGASGSRNGSVESPVASGSSSPNGPAATSSGGGGSNLADKSGEELIPIMPTAGDFPQGSQVQPFINKPGEANVDDRVKPLPPEATNPPGCWDYLEIRKNRDDLPDITRIVTTQGKNDQGQLVAAAQLAKENNNVDALAAAKAWLATCKQFDYTYLLKEGQLPIHFEIAPLPGPPGFADPFFGASISELGPQGPRGYRYFFAARVRGLLVLSEGVCDLSHCDQNQNSQMKQQIPIMFSKMVQGLRALP